MLAPFFSEDGQVNLLACIEQMNLIQYVYQNDRDGLQSYLDRFGGGTVVFFEAQPATLPPQVAVIRESATRYSVVVAGTTNWKQWVGNFWGAFGEDYDLRKSQVVHTFFRKERDRIWSAILRDRLPPEGDLHVSFSGHSMGGAVADLLADKTAFATEGRAEIDVLTFAAPKPLAGPKDRHGSIRMGRIVHAGDIVPFTPPVSALLLFLSPLNVGTILPTAYNWVHPIDRIRIDGQGGFKLDGSPENEIVEGNFPSSAEGFLDSHIWPRYTQSLAATAFRFPPESFTEDEKARIQDAVTNAGGAMRSAFVPLPLPSTFTDPAKVNRALVGSETGPVTPQNLNTLSGVSANTLGLTVPTRNMAGLFRQGASMTITRSPYTKVTLIIGNGQCGVSHSFATQSGSSGDFAAVMDRAKKLAERWSTLFGCNTGDTGVYPTKTLGSPCVTALRLTDPKLPRLGILVPLNVSTSSRFFGYGKTSADAADRLSTTISLRMQGQGPDKFGYANVIFAGQPDGVVKDGSYNPNFTYSTFTTKTWDQLFSDLLKFLVSDQWGFMGRDWGQADKTSGAITLNSDGYPIFTIGTHGYVNDDIIVIKGADVRGLPHKGRVVKIDDNSFRITRKWTQPVTPLPSTATVFRVMAADKTVYSSFYQFTGRPEGFQSPLQVSVRSHRPGREFQLVSFGKHGPRKRI